MESLNYIYTNGQRRNQQIRKKIQEKNGNASKPAGYWNEQNPYRKKTKKKTPHWTH